MKGLPVFLRAVLNIDGIEVFPTDTYVDMSSFNRGYIWINGFLLGRYITVLGPQLTLFVPSALLNTGRNEVSLHCFRDMSGDRDYAKSVMYALADRCFGAGASFSRNNTCICHCSKV